MTALMTMMMMATVTEGFNLDVSLASVRKGPGGSDFGFSVALWSDKRGKQRLVVGAPQDSRVLAQGGDVALPLGSVYMCELDEEECQVDARVPNFPNAGRAPLVSQMTSQQHHVHFGQSLATEANAPSHLAMCAPHYPMRKGDSLEIRGACFLLSHPEGQATRFVPYSRTKRISRSFEHAMAGFSSALFRQENLTVVVGGPGAYYAKGVVYLKELGSRGVGQVSRYSTSEGDEETYEGWGVALGRFDGTTRMFVAASAVNFGSYTGRVKIYPSDFTAEEQSGTNYVSVLEGEECGAKFGYSLASGDIDGDGADDLVVGAPLTKGEEGVPDGGAVFVYYAPAKHISPRRDQLLGKTAWARFGLAVTSLADINLDGYADIAVGAPYAGGGEVFVFNGGPEGIRTKPSMVLRASDFHHGLRGFGFSLAGGVDVDGNLYPDLAVGALASNAVVLLRSAPVVTLVGEVGFQAEEVEVEDAACFKEQAGHKKVKGVCFLLKVDLQYKSYKSIGPLRVELSLVLEGESDPPNSIFFHNDYHKYLRNVTIPYFGKALPLSVKIFTKSNRSIIGQHIGASVTARLLPKPINSSANQRLVDVPPVLDALGPTSFSAGVVLTCDDNATCLSKPDLSVEGVAHPLEVGGPPLAIDVTLHVKSDPAYSAEVTLQHHPALRYHRVAADASHHPPHCRLPGLVGVVDHTSVVCSFPFLQIDTEVNFTVYFDHDPVALTKYLQLEGESRELSLVLQASSDSVDTNLEDNAVTIIVPTLFDTVLYTQSTSSLDYTSVKVNRTASLAQVMEAATKVTNLTLDDLGPMVVHEFLLTNRGPAPVSGTTLELSIPLYTPDGLPVSYVYTPPATTGPVRCSPLNIDALGILGSERERSGRPRQALPPPPQPPPAPASPPPPPPPPSNPSPPPPSPPVGDEQTRRRRRSALASPATTPFPASTDYYYPDYHYYTDDAYYYTEEAYVTAPATDRHMVSASEKKIPVEEYRPPKDTSSLQKIVLCTEPRCRMTCEVDTLAAGAFVKVSIASRLVVAGLDQLGYRTVTVATLLDVRKLRDDTTLINPRLLTKTTLALIKPQEANFFAVPLWLLLLAVLLAVFLMLIIMAGLWKAGFFKRDRPPAHRGSLINQECCKPDLDLDLYKPSGEI